MYCSNIFAQDREGNSSIDSLYNSIAKAKGEEKLRLCYSLVTLLDNSNDIALCKEVIEQYVAEAKAQKNTVHTTQAWQTQMMYFYKYDRKNFFSNYADFMEFAKINSQWKAYYSIFESHIFVMLQLKKTNQAIEETKSMYEEAIQASNLYGQGMTARILSRIYIDNQRYEEADKNLSKALEIFAKIKSVDDQMYVYKFLLYSLKHQGKYKEAEKLLLKVKELLKQSGKQDDENNFFIDIEYAVLYTNTNHFDKAQSYFNKIKSYLNTKSVFHWESYNHRLMELKIKQKKYAESLIICDSLYNFHKQQNNKKNLTCILSLKVFLLGKTGHGSEAADLFQEYMAVKDSVDGLAINSQLDQLRLEYDVDRIFADNKRHQSVLIYISIIVILFAAIIFVLSFYIINMRRKNKVIYQQILNGNRLGTKLTSNDLSKDAMQSSKELFDKINVLFAKEQLYLKEDVDRHKLAGLLNTNYEYIRQAIKECASMSVGEYITSLRLQHSLTLLSDANNNDTLNIIASECGFNAISTFHRLFMLKYGIAPGEFRKNVKNNK
jgi:AraC-like DNA-binding protein